jgi:pimeloyl-ACP methyl ester carboxylesterase
MALLIRQSVSSSGETIYWPEVETLRGGIVCLHGSEGGRAGWNELNCVIFAAHGFAALAHNYSQSTRWLMHPDIENVPLDSTEAALAALRAELADYGCGIGLFGTSRGAEHALLLAQLLAEDGCSGMPDAVAVHSPPDETWPAFIVADFKTGKPWAGDRQRPAWSWRGTHERTRPGTPLGMGLHACPVFISQGMADEVWDAELAQRLVARMSEAGYPPEAHFFEGEGHVFSAEARNREWALMLRFFDRHLGSSE